MNSQRILILIAISLLCTTACNFIDNTILRFILSLITFISGLALLIIAVKENKKE